MVQRAGCSSRSLCCLMGVFHMTDTPAQLIRVSSCDQRATPRCFLKLTTCSLAANWSAIFCTPALLDTSP